MIESDIFNALKGLVANRVYPDVAPDGVAKPYVTYQQIGGEALNYLEAVPVGMRNGRFQVNCWAETRAAAATLSRQVEDAMVTTLKATVVGAPIAVYEDDLKLYGTMQDFSVWFSD